MKNSKSINKKLITLQLAVLSMALIGVLIVSLYISNKYHMDSQKRYLRHITNDVNENIVQNINVIKNQLQIIGQDEALEHYIENNQESLLESFLYHYKDILPTICYIDEDGEVLKKMQNGVFVDKVCDFKQYSLYQQTLNNPNKVVISSIEYSPTIKTYIFKFAFQKVGYFGDELQGIIAGDIPLENLINKNEFQDNQKMIFRIISKDGDIEFSSIPKEISTKVKIQDDTKKHISNFLTTPKDKLHRITINGIDGYTYSLPLFNNNSVLLLSCSYVDFMEIPFKQLKLILTIFIIILLIALIATYKLSSNITNPLNTLSKALSLISKGDYSKHIDIKTGDELEILSQHFNEMSDELKLSKQKIEKNTQELEEKVQKRTKQLKEKLYIDDLTHIPNRYSFFKTLSLSSDKEIPVIFLIDIDSFKTYNKLYGTDVGNKILIEFSHLLKQYIKDNNYQLYRISGDEFVLYETVNNIDVEKYETTLNKLFYFIEHNKIYIESINEYLEISVTIGVSFSHENPLGKADMALHDAKLSGKNFATYNMLMDTTKELQNTLYWKREIRQALEEDRVVPFFQAIVNRNKQIIKYEALIRIKQYSEEGEEDIISPFHFMNIAIQTKQYNHLSYTVIDKALTAIKEKNISLSINMDMHDFSNHALTSMIKKHLVDLNRLNQENGTTSNYIALEILEDEEIKNYESFSKQLEKFKKLGAFIAIDDFGSGYSNLSHIIGISPKFLKIDATLIKNIATDKHSYKIVQSVVQFAKALGIKTIAEYVATKEIFDIVYELGIDEFQGYYFGKPVSVDEI